MYGLDRNGCTDWAGAVTQLARVSVLVLDDFLLTPASVEACRDLLEVIEDRAGLRSSIFTSQLPIANWHEAITEPTIADSLMDRLCWHLRRIELHGESMRRRNRTGAGSPAEEGPSAPSTPKAKRAAR